MSTPLSQPRSPGLGRSTWAAVERARLTVVPRTATPAPRVPFITLVSVLLVGGVVGLLLFNTHMQQGSFVAASLEERAAVLAAEEQSLTMQLDRLRDPQHVAARARRLGMVPASTPAFIRLSDGKVLGRPLPADQQDAIRIAPLPAAKPASVRPDLVVVEAPPPREAHGRRDTAGRSRGTSDASAAPSRTKRENTDRSGPGRSRGSRP